MDHKREAKSVVCSNLPENLNKRQTLLKHFSQFGQVNGISCSRTSKYALVHFSTATAARAAKENGTVIDKDYAPVEIYFSGKSSGVGNVKQKERPTFGPLSKYSFSTKRLSHSASSGEPSRVNRPAISILQDNIRAYLTPAISSEIKATDNPLKSTAATAFTKPTKRLRRSSFTFSSTLPDHKSSPPHIPAVDTPADYQDLNSYSESKTNPPRQPFTFSLHDNKEKPVQLFEGVSQDESGSTKPEAQVQEIQMTTNENTNLQELLYKRTTTSEDRYRVLDARDKLLRMKNPKVKVRVEFAVKLVGVCQDMCPEKERYMREAQRQLVHYECLPSEDPEVDHSKAVKQYSRSSADQEEPLPHDLRPTSTLEMTMSYLLHNIVSRSESPHENLMEWYTFMWDRTRSIRKDITQQELCDLKAVSLMEKCTRFHIHCSSRLCEMDRHAFDPKLNDENLMKCLQSLEHMYADLNLKGVRCPREPEFRTYQILMNLNEGDILWEIQQKTHVLRSSEVQHALKIHLAIFQKNFVAFFRLVRQSSYMTSCILHRYFFQVRSFTLRRLNRAHSVPPRFDSIMPTNIAQKLLGFGPSEEDMFIHFCENHGIIFDKRDETVVINRKRLIYPEAPIVNREYDLIESKLQMTVAEAINGEPLGANPLLSYSPQSSFDEQGYLRKDDIDGRNFGVFGAPTIVTKRVSPVVQEDKLDEQGYLRKDHIDGRNFGLFGVPTIVTKPVVQEDKLDERLVRNYTQDVLNSLINESVAAEVREISKTTLLQIHQLKEAEMVRMAWQSAEQTIRADIFSEITNQTVSETVRVICSQELAIFRSLDLCAREIENKLRAEVVNELIVDVCQQVHKNALKERDDGIRKGVKLLVRVQKSLWLQYWKCKASEKRTARVRLVEKRKSDIENFPPSLSISLSPAIILGSLGFNCLKNTMAVEKRQVCVSIPDLLSIDLSSELNDTTVKSDENNFPPSLSLSLPPATILESLGFNRLEYAMAVKKPQVLVSTSDLLSVELSGEVNDTGRNCCDSTILNNQRKRSLSGESLSPSAKNARQHSTSLLTDIYDFIEEVRKEKESFQVKV